MPKSHTLSRKRLSRIGRSRLPGGLGTLVTATSAIPRHSRSLCHPVQYAIPGSVPALKQDQPATAWAAQLAVLIAWRDDQPYTVEQALARLGERWVELWKSGSSLSKDDTALLCATGGLCVGPAQSPSAEEWESLLRTYGPLCVLPGGDDASFPARGRIVVSISGDGTPENTRLGVVDTSTGSNVTEPLSAFAGPVRVVHWHADAGLGRGVRPTAPAAPTPEQAPSPEANAPAPNASAASLWRAVREVARQADVPAWDQVGKFPIEIRRFWADIASRMHHYIWHAVRIQHPHPQAAVRDAFRRMGFTPPPRLAAQFDRNGNLVRAAAAGAGVDFLSMHRQMVQATRTLAAQLKLDYRPTGWSPIPWSHTDPVWPVPAWPASEGVPGFKEPEVTVFWRGQVRDNLENPKWLSGVSLDRLGTTLEEGIHNWMHMHWASAPPSDRDAGSADPSNDYLGSTFSSQVNPIFWKLHGWIDECITRWEKAPAQAGTGSERSAAADLAKFAWLGPIPRPQSKSLQQHTHADIPESELFGLAARIDFAAQPEFASARMNRQQLVARFGPSGETPDVWLAEAVGGDGRSAMASLRPSRRVAVGFERHAVRGAAVPEPRSRQLNPVAAIELGAAAFSVIQPLVSGGDFSYSAAVTEYVHKNPATPPETPTTRTKVWLVFKADAKVYPVQHFWFEVQFDHNGYDLKNCRIDPVRGKSASLFSSTFHVDFSPAAASDERAPEARIRYAISGRWDPKLGGDHSFKGEVVLRAGGMITAVITHADGGTVWIPTNGGLNNVRSEALPVPTVIAPFWDFKFSPSGSHKLVEKEHKELLAWLDRLPADDLAGLKGGRLLLEVHGFASTTGEYTSNWELSRKRAQAVEKVLRDVLVPGTPNIQVRPHGEQDARTPDKTESDSERRVRVQFKKYIWP
ncbi:MAG: papain-like cysteine protease family protein [Gemmatimonadales bacterium]